MALYKSEASQFPLRDVSPAALGCSLGPQRSFQRHSCVRSKFIISLSISDRHSGRSSGSLKCRKAFPWQRSSASQQVRKVNLLPLSKLLSVLKGRERGGGERGSRVGLLFFHRCPNRQPLRPSGPFEISPLVNGCLRNAWGGQRRLALSTSTKARSGQGLKCSFSPSYCSLKVCFLLTFTAQLILSS